jgi:protein-tyrosine phosphatase
MPANRPALLPPPAPKDPFPKHSLRIYKICAVCLGNICRSPMAETLVRAELAAAGLSERVSVESAGTGDWHLGEPMDRQAQAELARRGYDGSAHRARQIGPGWLGRFDLLIAMDASNLRDLERMAAGRPELTGPIRLLRSFDPAAPAGAEVPDPYGGGPGQFAEVFDMVQAAARGLVAELAVMLGDPTGPAGD